MRKIDRSAKNEDRTKTRYVNLRTVKKLGSYSSMNSWLLFAVISLRNTNIKFHSRNEIANAHPRNQYIVQSFHSPS